MTPDGAAGSTRLNSRSTSLPGMRMWLESMNSTSPACSPSKTSAGAACSVVGTIRTPGRLAMSARGAGSMATISPRPPVARDSTRVELPEPTSTMCRGLRSRTRA